MLGNSELVAKHCGGSVFERHVSLAVFLQDEYLRVDIVFWDDMADLCINRLILYVHGVSLEPWIGPKGSSSRSSHDQRT